MLLQYACVKNTNEKSFAVGGINRSILPAQPSLHIVPSEIYVDRLQKGNDSQSFDTYRAKKQKKNTIKYMVMNMENP